MLLDFAVSISTISPQLHRYVKFNHERATSLQISIIVVNRAFVIGLLWILSFVVLDAVVDVT